MAASGPFGKSYEENSESVCHAQEHAREQKKIWNKGSLCNLSNHFHWNSSCIVLRDFDRFRPPLMTYSFCINMYCDYGTVLSTILFSPACSIELDNSNMMFGVFQPSFDSSQSLNKSIKIELSVTQSHADTRLLSLT